MRRIRARVAGSALNPLSQHAGSRIRTCAHGSGESEIQLSDQNKCSQASNSERCRGADAVGCISCRWSLRFQIQAARRYRLLGQAGLSSGSMPCWRSTPRSRSISSARCWHRSARSVSAGCPTAHWSLPRGLTGQQFLLPVTERRGLLIVLGVDGSLLLGADYLDLFIQVPGIGSGPNPLLDGRQPLLDRLQASLPCVQHELPLGRSGRHGLLALVPVQQLDHLLAHPLQVRALPHQHLSGHAARRARSAGLV